MGKQAKWDGQFLPGDVVRNAAGYEFTISRVVPGRVSGQPYLKVIAAGETEGRPLGYPAGMGFVRFVRRAEAA